jgi:hypothetical protein
MLWRHLPTRKHRTAKNGERAVLVGGSSHFHKPVWPRESVVIRKDHQIAFDAAEPSIQSGILSVTRLEQEGKRQAIGKRRNDFSCCVRASVIHDDQLPTPGG